VHTQQHDRDENEGAHAKAVEEHPLTGMFILQAAAQTRLYQGHCPTSSEGILLVKMMRMRTPELALGRTVYYKVPTKKLERW
jgi:hypothetical protein